ncbi:hypothetical protein PybrP1_008814 [[Pythium] brassicae (nom. inval.)]|nr:hypothetical protein PybrP1_008814 [[Pythium] brassicae (nom. inval.)]
MRSEYRHSVTLVDTHSTGRKHELLERAHGHGVQRNYRNAASTAGTTLAMRDRQGVSTVAAQRRRLHVCARHSRWSRSRALELSPRSPGARLATDRRSRRRASRRSSVHDNAALRERGEKLRGGEQRRGRSHGHDTLVA